MSVIAVSIIVILDANVLWYFCSLVTGSFLLALHRFIARIAV